MSGYSGGVSIQSANDYNRELETFRFFKHNIGTNLIYAASTAGTNRFDDLTANATFWSFVGRGGNDWSVTLAANISAGVTLLNKTGKGFIGAIVLPVSSTSAGNMVLTVTIDGAPKVFTLPCLANNQRYVIAPYKPEGQNEGYGSTTNGKIIESNELVLLDISKYITDGKAIRFLQSAVITLSSPTALAVGGAPYQSYAIQCALDVGV